MLITFIAWISGSVAQCQHGRSLNAWVCRDLFALKKTFKNKNKKNQEPLFSFDPLLSFLCFFYCRHPSRRTDLPEICCSQTKQLWWHWMPHYQVEKHDKMIKGTEYLGGHRDGLSFGHSAADAPLHFGVCVWGGRVEEGKGRMIKEIFQAGNEREGDGNEHRRSHQNRKVLLLHCGVLAWKRFRQVNNGRSIPPPRPPLP